MLNFTMKNFFVFQKLCFKYYVGNISCILLYYKIQSDNFQIIIALCKNVKWLVTYLFNFSFVSSERLHCH